ncbi:MAG: cell division protein FtsX [Paracoccaceae bacterium]
MTDPTDSDSATEPADEATPRKAPDPPRTANAVPAKRAPPILPTTGWTAWLTMLLAGVMCLLAVLTLSASMAANRLAAEWRSDLAGVATVRVSGTRDGMTDRIRSVLEVLRTTPGISRVRVLTDEEQTALISPWLGEGDVLADLPVPRLIDIVLDGAGPDAGALQDRLDLTVQGALYDDHAAWRGPLANAAGALERLALGATFIILLTAAGVVAFAARATLSANHRVIETLRLVGAEDRFIARSFVRRLAQRAAIGGLIGALFGCAILKLLPGIDEGLILPKVESGQRLGVSLEPGLVGWAILAIGIPLIIALIVWLAARFTVQLTLSRMP